MQTYIYPKDEKCLKIGLKEMLGLKKCLGSKKCRAQKVLGLTNFSGFKNVWGSQFLVDKNDGGQTFSDVKYLQGSNIFGIKFVGGSSGPSAVRALWESEDPNQIYFQAFKIMSYFMNLYFL